MSKPIVQIEHEPDSTLGVCRYLLRDSSIGLGKIKWTPLVVGNEMMYEGRLVCYAFKKEEEEE